MTKKQNKLCSTNYRFFFVLVFVLSNVKIVGVQKLFVRVLFHQGVYKFILLPLSLGG